VALATWLAFLLASVLIAISPGPGAATSMSAGLRHGYWTTLRAIGGLQCALLIQLAVVAAGLDAVLSASEAAFDLMKFLGAGYLVWLGFQKWRDAPRAIGGEDSAAGPRGLFAQGLLVNLTNPKAIVFMAALTPQFVDPARPRWLQFAIIGGTLCGVDTAVMSGYALLAARLRRWLRSPRAMKAQSRFFGGIFIALGVLLAASGRP
jgi:homoserine/homoserine lactone efflux protein